jgi:hypothetical protein
MKLFILTAFCLFLTTFSAFAQANSDFFPQVEKLLNKAKGEKMTDGVSGNKEKIGRQIFTRNLVSTSEIGLSKYGSEWIRDCKNMNWKSLEYYMWELPSNDKVSLLTIKFKNDFKYTYHVEGEEAGEERSYDKIELYFLSKDQEKIKSLFESN